MIVKTRFLIIIVSLHFFYSYTNVHCQSNSWRKSQIPSFFPGGVEEIAAKENIVLAVLWNKGTVRSTDSGSSWTLVSQTIFRYIKITKLNIIFACGSDGRLYRSVDWGNSWNEWSNIYGILNIFISPEDYIYIQNYEAFFRSTDSGYTWTKMMNGLKMNQTWMTIAMGIKGDFIAKTDMGYFLSKNKGFSWAQISAPSSFAHGGVTMAINAKGYIFVSDITHLFRSIDNGMSWKKIRDEGSNFLFIDPLSDNIVDPGMGQPSYYYVSGDNGNSWNKINTDYYVTCFTSDNRGNFFIGLNKTGILKSQTKEGPWINCTNNIPGSGIEISSVYPFPGGVVLAGSNGHGFYISNNRGRNFSLVSPDLNKGVGSNILKIIQTSDKNLLALANQTVYKSSDQGKTWTNISKEGSLLYNNNLADITSVGQVVLVAAGTFNNAKLFRSVNNGKTWNTACNTTRINSFISITLNSTGIAIAGTTGDSGLRNYPTNYGHMRSTDFGATWQVTDAGYFDNPNFTQFAWSPDETIVYAASGKGVYFSTDLGIKWTKCTGVLPENNISSILINSKGYVYVATSKSGIFVSKDNGNSWSDFNADLTDLNIKTLAIDAEGCLYAGTKLGGIFKTVQDTTVSEKPQTSIPTSFVLHQNYPNPFNPTTVVNYSIPQNGLVTLKTFDVLGKEVSTLVNEEKSPGYYSVNFNGAGLSSGIYFYQLQSGNLIITKKMILLK